MNHTELRIKTTINDLEPKLDKNQNLYFKLAVKWGESAQTFYAFTHNLSAETLTTLKETPEKLINQLVLITYQEITSELAKRLNNNVLTDDDRMSLIRILLKPNQKSPLFT